MQKSGEKTVYQGRWLRIKELYYEKEGHQVTWETVERVTEYGVIVMVARLVPSRRVLLLKQFRPLINNYIIGFPAGIAESPDIEKEALRELLEETGYQGSVKQVSPALKSNPALIDDTVFIVNIEIDEDDPVNQHPAQCLEPSEEIEVLLVEEGNIREFLLEKHRQGYEIGIGPWYAFALRGKDKK